jgi:Transcriptional regulatory protein, C terminal
VVKREGAASPFGLPLTYRKNEIGEVVAPCLRAGDSCSVVGVSGMAKSNLFRHLLDPGVRRHFLGGRWRDFLFVAADLNALGRVSEEAVYELLTGSLPDPPRRGGRDETAGGARAKRRQTPPVGGDAGPALRFNRAVRSLLSGSASRRLVVLLDQFDEAYRALPPYVFANLRAVRDEHKYRVSYVLFTREELPYLNRAPECEEFYELLSANVLGLGPYERSDALTLVERVSERYGRRLPRGAAGQLLALSGGHPGILKAACMSLLRGRVELRGARDEAAAALLGVDDVRGECEKVWRSISAEERRGIRGLCSAGPAWKFDAETERRLRLKHLLDTRGGGAISVGPVFMAYVSALKDAPSAETLVQAGPIRIDTSGETWVGESRLAPPLTKMESLLLAYLCREPGRLRTREEIITAVYPDVYASGGTVSDDAINALVRRLRERVETPSGGQCRITTARGKGYRLEIPFAG